MEVEESFIDQKNNEKIKKQKRKSIKRNHYMILLGLVLLFGGYVSTLTLQTSIRVESGLGAKITTITYATLSFFSFFVAPAILRLLGPKKSLIVSECGYLIYVFTNFFSSEPILYIGALAASFGESIFWIPIGICFIHFAKKYHKYSNKSEEECIMEFGSFTLGIFQISQIVGNSIITLVLNILKFDEPISSTTNPITATYFLSNVSHTNPYTTTSFPLTNMSVETETNPYQHCGANDCQNQDVIEESIDQYVPKNPLAMYIIIGCFLLMVILGIICHIKMVPEMPLSSYNSTSKRRKSTKDSDMEIAVDKEVEKDKSVKQILTISFNTTKELFLQFFDPHQLLFVTPYGIYVGLNSGLNLSEVTRAFASCILGVSQVGVCIIIFASFNCLHSLLIGKVFGRRGRIPLVVFGIFYDTTLYLILILWQPTYDSKWIVYILFGLLGISNATCQVVIATICGSEFYKTKEVSFNIWMIAFSLGLALQNAFSTLLCVRIKLFIMMAWVVIAGTMACIHEFRAKKFQN